MKRASMSDYYSFKGFNIPVDLLNKTGGGVENFDEISNGHISYLKKNIGIKKNDKILEVGCGIGRDAIPLTEILGEEGSYYGIDIIGRSIKWCKNNISTRYKNFQFIHFNVKDQLHNPLGLRNQQNLKIPLQNDSIDTIFLWSVVTHLFEKDIVHYFKEFNRVLKPNGVIMITCFIVDDKILKKLKKINLTPYDLKFEHYYDDGCFINNKDVPAGAVAFTYEKMLEMINSGGLVLDRDLHVGNWWGKKNSKGFGQDVIFMKKNKAKKMNKIDYRDNIFHKLVKYIKSYF